MKCRATESTEPLGLELAHSRIEKSLQASVGEYGMGNAEEALVLAPVIREEFYLAVLLRLQGAYPALSGGRST